MKRRKVEREWMNGKKRKKKCNWVNGKDEMKRRNGDWMKLLEQGGGMMDG